MEAGKDGRVTGAEFRAEEGDGRLEGRELLGEGGHTGTKCHRRESGES